jgi:enterochelin esterase-like enzyme
MITRRWVLGCGSGLAVAGGQALAGPTYLITYPLFPSTHVDPRNVHIWLPTGYHSSSQRYPVIYFQDGQNAFSPAFAFRGEPWNLDQALLARERARRDSGVIIVAIWNTAKRRSEFALNQIEVRLPIDLQSRLNRESGHPPAGDNYLKFIVRELKPFIDRTYRTNPDPASTILMGASRGAILSLYGLCEFPHTFGAAACLSTHWLLVSAPGTGTNPNLEAPAVSKAIEEYIAEKLPHSRTHRVWMDHGNLNLDSYYQPYQHKVDMAFLAKDWTIGQDFQSRLYPGSDHNEVAWRTRVAEPLDFVLPTDRLG